MKLIHTDELEHRLEQGPVALFDVRGDIAYEQGHIPGSLTAPLGSLTFRVAGTMHRGSFVVVYDDGADDTLAVEAVERLEGLGMTDVHLYAEGLSGWRAAGLGFVESPSPKIHTQGPVIECRALLVDRERSYGGAFNGRPTEVGGAGG